MNAYSSLQRSFANLLVPVIAGMLLLPFGANADKPRAETKKTAPYVVEASRKDSSADFTAFLERCSLEERVCLMQSLMGLKDYELAKHHFGKLQGLGPWNAYTDKSQKPTKDKPRRPETFNDVPPLTVLDAIERAILPESCVSPMSINNELLWNCCNKLRYPWLKNREVDYHREVLQWVCGKRGLPKTVIESLSSYDLERKFVERYFEEIWDKLSPEQRTELLGKIEGTTKTTIVNKSGIAAMSGGAAMAAIATTVAVSGFAFYTTMSTTLATVATWFGATVSFSTYAGMSSTIAVLAGPVGWTIAIAGIGGGAALAGWPDSQKTSNFVITVHLIKERWNDAKGVRSNPGKTDSATHKKR